MSEKTVVVLDLIQRASDNFTSAPAQALADADAALALIGPEAQADAELLARARWARGVALVYGAEFAASLQELQRALDGVPPAASRLRITLLRALSVANEQLGALDAALDWALQATEAARLEDDEALLADALISMAVAQSRCGDAAKGQELNLEALAIYRRRGNSDMCASALNNIGIDLKNLGRYAQAVQHQQEAMALARAAGNLVAAAVVACNMGETLTLMGRHEEALAELMPATALLADCGYRSAEINARIVLGQVLDQLGQPEPALAQLEQAIELTQQTGERNHLARGHLVLSDLHKRAGRPELALVHLEAHHKAERAQFNQESDRKLRALQVQYGLATARREAEFHRLAHAKLAAAHAELQALNDSLTTALAEKSILLRQVETLSRTDALTGLANRRHLDEQLQSEFIRAQRLGHELTLAMCDLDNFKRINDRLGHGVGDAVLRAVGRLLRQLCREIDIVARYGGEEFCVVFIEADLAQAGSACEALRRAVEAHDWASVHPELDVTLSIGLASAARLGGHEALLSAADAQLYDAKRQGKNRVNLPVF